MAGAGDNASESIEKPAAVHPILLVDDDPTVQTIIQQVLVTAGFTVVGAASASAAIALIDARPFRFVLSDFEMPDHDGLWLLNEARARQPEAVRILCSGAELDPKHAASGLVQHYLRKPFRKSELFAILRSYPP